jgi:hypothetical protein
MLRIQRYSGASPKSTLGPKVFSTDLGEVPGNQITKYVKKIINSEQGEKMSRIQGYS